MTAAPFRLEALEGRHDRSVFASGDARLDRYFQTQVTQDVRRRVANCFVAVEVSSGRVAAHYTIASASVPTQELPPEVARRLPRYPTLPVVRVGRLAADREFRGRGLGKALLADAALKTIAAAPAAFALMVDAKNDQAVEFYEHHGFRRLTGSANMLFLPIATAGKLLLEGKV